MLDENGQWKHLHNYAQCKWQKVAIAIDNYMHNAEIQINNFTLYAQCKKVIVICNYAQCENNRHLHCIYAQCKQYVSK